MEISRHEGGSDILTSAEDLSVALGVRLRERPGTRWVVQMHPETRAQFDVAQFEERFGADDVTLDQNRYIMPGEYHLAQSGFDRERTDTPAAR